MNIWIDVLKSGYIGAFGFDSELKHLALSGSGPNIEDIIMGRITGMMGSQALVDIGRPLPALMNLKKPLPQGHKMWVQVTRQEISGPYQNKGCKVSADLTISGTYLRVKPYGTGIVGARSLNAARIQSLKSLLSPSLKGGIILRSSVSALEDDSIVLEELNALSALWADAPYAAPIPPFKLLLDLPKIDSISSSNWDLFEELLAFLKVYRPCLLAVSKFIPSIEDPELRTASMDVLEELLDPTIALPGGGHGVIQETLACTAIDINTSASYLETPPGSIYWELARQIHVRGLGGLIVIDWPAMTSVEKNAVQRGLEKACKIYGGQVLGWTKGGLIEILRPRRGPSLRERLWSPP